MILDTLSTVFVYSLNSFQKSQQPCLQNMFQEIELGHQQTVTVVTTRSTDLCLWRHSACGQTIELYLGSLDCDVSNMSAYTSIVSLCDRAESK